MKQYPEIYAATFGDDRDPQFCQQDAAINADIFAAVFQLVGPMPSTEGWTAGYPWRIEIVDQHDENEPEPHYVLSFGEQAAGDDEQLVDDGFKAVKVEVPYVDNWSRFAAPAAEPYAEASAEVPAIVRTVEQNPGMFRVRVFYKSPAVFDIPPLEVAKKIGKAYLDSMHARIPGLFVMAYEKILRV